MKRLFTIALFFLITGSYAQTYLPLNSYISGGWNIDVIAEGSSPLTSTGYRVPLATNGSLSNYDFNYGDALNAQDFSGKFGAPSSYYLPSSGAITNTAVSGCTFQLQPYTSNNAVFVSSGSSASLTLTANADIRADELIFLVVNDNQYYSSSCIAQVAVHFSDATSESFIVQVGGMWSNNAATKAATVGRVGTRNNNDWFWMNSNSISLHYIRVSLDAANKIKKLALCATIGPCVKVEINK